MKTCLLFLALTCGHPKLVALHIAAATFDGLASNTHYAERDPLVRRLIGSPPTRPRMALFGAAEVISVEFLPPKLRKPARIVLIGAHLAAAGYSLKHR